MSLLLPRSTNPLNSSAHIELNHRQVCFFKLTSQNSKHIYA